MLRDIRIMDDRTVDMNESLTPEAEVVVPVKEQVKLYELIKSNHRTPATPIRKPIMFKTGSKGCSNPKICPIHGNLDD